MAALWGQVDEYLLALDGAKGLTAFRKVDIRLPGKGNSTSHGARPVHQIISMKQWIRTSRLSIKNSLSQVDAFLAALDEAKGLTAFNGFKFDIPFIHREFKVCNPPLGSFSSLLLSSLELSDIQVYEP